MTISTRLFALSACLFLSACATVPLKQAEAVAMAGQSATAAMESSLAHISDQAGHRMELVAFTTTLENCEGLSECEPYVDSEDLAGAYRTYVGHVALRRKAVRSLGQAYTAMLEDAQTETRSAIEEPIGKAVDSVSELASAVFPGANLISDQVKSIAQQLAGLKAEQDQARRLKAANAILAEATDVLAKALAKEQAEHDDVAADMAEVRADFEAQLFATGVLSRMDELRSLAKIAGVDLPEDLVLSPANQSRLATALDSARTIALSNEAANRAADAKDRPSAYAAALRMLDAMAALHKAYGQVHPSHVDHVRFMIEELQKALGNIEDQSAGGEQGS